MIPLLEYKFDDINGFELGSDFEELYAKRQIDYGNDCTLSLRNGNLKLRYTESTPNEISTKVENIYTNMVNKVIRKDVLGTLGVKIETIDKQFVYIGGIKIIIYGLVCLITKRKRKLKNGKIIVSLNA